MDYEFPHVSTRQELWSQLQGQMCQAEVWGSILGNMAGSSDSNVPPGKSWIQSAPSLDCCNLGLLMATFTLQVYGSVSQDNFLTFA